MFSAEATTFRESGEFEDIAEDYGLEAYWDSWRGPDAE